MSETIENREEAPSHFIRDIMIEDVKAGKNGGKVITRFPPEPNGYLHIGHAKAIVINFQLAKEFGGRCHLRFDDTNAVKEDVEYVTGIMEDIKWLGFDWGEHLYYASDYFDKMYDFAVELIKQGKAYVCELTADEIREYRGTPTEPGKNSPYRKRSAEENLRLFEKMKNGEVAEGKMTLRAKIDMASPNFNMRDPVMYRIMFAEHHHTGHKWCIYPMYDWAHGLEDSVEGVTHSLCSIEYEDHRPLYDWFLDQLPIHHPRQIEFARLNVNYTVLSKRKLIQLVNEKLVSGWDDPRMPTLRGLRRRGFTPQAILTFIDRSGVSKTLSVADFAFLEYCQREQLNKTALRLFVVLKPLKVIIDNYPEGKEELFDAENNPEDASMGTRTIPFSRVVYIEQEDFQVNPPKKYYRLSPGKEIRLKYAYYIKCESFVQDPATGEITEVHCTYDPASRGGWTNDQRMVKGTSHWVSAAHAVPVEVRLYDKLFTREDPENAEMGRTFLDYINSHSLEILKNCLAEPVVNTIKKDDRFQFLRQGYFCLDSADSKPGSLVFNRTVSLKDSWSKIAGKQGGA